MSTLQPKHLLPPEPVGLRLHAAPARTGVSGVAEIVQVPVQSFNSSLTGGRPALGGMI